MTTIPEIAMSNTLDYSIVYITTESFDAAKHLSRILVTEKLAACCTIVQNSLSVFAWGSALQERYESLIIVKTLSERFAELESRVRQIHTDEVPEIISVPVNNSSQPYLDWIEQVLQY